MFSGLLTPSIEHREHLVSCRQRKKRTVELGKKKKLGLRAKQKAEIYRDTHIYLIIDDFTQLSSFSK